MRTEAFIVFGAVIWLLCCLPAESLNVTKSEAVKSESGADNKNANKTNYVEIPNAQTKIVNGPEISKVQLQEAAEKDKNSKEVDLAGKKSRKTTPTDKNPVAGNIPKDNDSVKPQQPAEVTVKSKVVAEGVALEVPTSTQNGNKTELTEKQGAVIKPVVAPHNNTDNKTILEKQNNTTTSTKLALNSTTTTIKPTTLKATTATTKKTTTTKTTSTTTTTTTPKPRKPLITYGLEDFPEKDLLKAASAAAAAQTTSKQPIPETAPIREFPNAEPSQEMSASYHSKRDYIVPVLTIMFTLPLAIGVLITAYRRFRDYWSTRHYRRMDFLVDGMYNE